MSEERRRVLDLLSHGKITVDEAEQLLQALASETGPQVAPPHTDGEKPKPRYLRIEVKKARSWPAGHDDERPVGAWPGFVWSGSRNKEINMRVPLALVRSGLRLGAIIPGIAGEKVQARLREQGLDIDLSKLDPATIESMLSELGEMNIDIDSGRAQVRITCE
jgi:hypothetical protein